MKSLSLCLCIDIQTCRVREGSSSREEFLQRPILSAPILLLPRSSPFALHYGNSLRVIRWPRSFASEQKAQNESAGEAADVRKISDTATACMPEGRGVLTEDLNHDPESEHNYGRQFNRRPQESERQQSAHAVFWEHDEICAQDSGYRTGCAKR